MALQADDVTDLVNGTLRELGRMKFTNIATRFQRYEALPRLWKRDKVQFDSGYGIRRSLMLDHSSAARNVGLFSTDDYGVQNVTSYAETPWRHTTVNYSWDLHEFDMNAGKEKIFDLVKVRRTDALIALTERAEADFWSKPTDSTDTVKPFGIDYWLVRDTTSAGGFDGGAPSGFSAGAGNLVHTRWRNWTAGYTSVSKADLLRKLRQAMYDIDWESPVDLPDYRTGRGQSYRMYVNRATILTLAELGESQNENLGRDLAPMDGAVAFWRTPIRYIPKLNDDSANPVYLVNTDTFYPVFMRGWYLKETKPTISRTQHNVLSVHLDCTYNYLCVDRRRNAVLAVA